MPFGSPLSEAFAKELVDKDFRNAFVADQVRTRIALLIRALREQEERCWSQAELGRRMGGKPQSVISRLEDPDYGKLSVQTLLEVASAFDLPLWIDIPEWKEWLLKIKEVPNAKTSRHSFDAGELASMARGESSASSSGSGGATVIPFPSSWDFAHGRTVISQSARNIESRTFVA